MELRDVVKLREEHEEQFSREQIVFEGIIVARTGSIKVSGIPNHFWVLPGGDEDATDYQAEPVAVYNRNVKPRANLAVQCGFAPKSSVLEILRTVIDSAYQIEDTGGINLEAHAGSHRVDGDDPLFIETRAIVALLTYPTGQTGIKVHVTSYNYTTDGRTHQSYPGKRFVDLSAYQPAAGSLMVLLYLDLATNTLNILAGTTIPQDTPAILPPVPNLPVNSVPSAFVRIGASATRLSWPAIYDARDFLYGVGRAAQVRQDMLHRIAVLENELDRLLSRHMVQGW